eukprot:6198840-Pleurochrysis_carterae.AAC.3
MRVNAAKCSGKWRSRDAQVPCCIEHAQQQSQCSVAKPRRLSGLVEAANRQVPPSLAPWQAPRPSATRRQHAELTRAYKRSIEKIIEKCREAKHREA